MTEQNKLSPGRNGYYVLSGEQVAQFRRDGHILLRGVASRVEIQSYRPLILEAQRRFGQAATPMEQRDAYGKAFLKGMNLWCHDEGVRQFVCSRRFAAIAADLLGTPGVRIYHDQALLKEPGGGPTPWHQDQHYWPLQTDQTITMWMPLVDITYEMGAMHFASGSHRTGRLGNLPISEHSEAYFERFIQESGFQKVSGVAMAAGDATFHYGWTLHGAPGNSSTQTREVMTIIWFADGTRVAPLDNVNRERDCARWLPGLQPGDLAASQLNPLVYQKAQTSA